MPDILSYNSIIMENSEPSVSLGVLQESFITFTRRLDPYCPLGMIGHKLQELGHEIEFIPEKNRATGEEGSLAQIHTSSQNTRDLFRHIIRNPVIKTLHFAVSAVEVPANILEESGLDEATSRKLQALRHKRSADKLRPFVNQDEKCKKYVEEQDGLAEELLDGHPHLTPEDLQSLVKEVVLSELSRKD